MKSQRESMPASARLASLTVALFLTSFSNRLVWGQVYSGSLTGVVSDPSGAVVPDAKLAAVDVNKGFAYSTMTNALGIYVLRNLPPSSYKLKVQKEGFTTFVRSGITLAVNENATLDVTLKVGATSQEVTVSAAAPLLASQDAVTATVAEYVWSRHPPTGLPKLQSVRGRTQ